LTRAQSSLVIAVFVIIVDQLTKQLAIQQLSGNKPEPSLFHGLITLTLTRNQGAAFGVLAGNGTLFVVIALVVAGAIALALAFYPIRTLATTMSLGLQLGGATGNVIDRIRQNYVVDFIHVDRWPIFNVADTCIVCGSLLLVYVWIRGVDQGDQEDRTAATTDIISDH
jgi:signal peptidase II